MAVAHAAKPYGPGPCPNSGIFQLVHYYLTLTHTHNVIIWLRCLPHCDQLPCLARPELVTCTETFACYQVCHNFCATRSSDIHFRDVGRTQNAWNTSAPWECQDSELKTSPLCAHIMGYIACPMCIQQQLTYMYDAWLMTRLLQDDHAAPWSNVG